jgi:basic amino acid/polyamine antiporter, APA family
VIGGFVALVAAVAPIDLLSQLVGIGTLFAFVLVCVAVIHLRATEPHLPRPFRVAYAPWLPILGIFACLGLMAGLSLFTWFRLLGWLAIGLVVYFAYGRSHSRLTGRG